MGDGVTASNAKNIREINAELSELKATVEDHGETIQEIESMREAVDDLDPDEIELDIPGGQTQDQSMLETITASLGNMGDKVNPFSESGQKTLSKGVVGGGLALGAFLLGGGPLGVAAALATPILGNAAAAAIGDPQQAVPDEVVETLGTSLAASEDFAKRIAGDPKLADQLANNEKLLNNLQDNVQSGEVQTGNTRFDTGEGDK